MGSVRPDLSCRVYPEPVDHFDRLPDSLILLGWLRGLLGMKKDKESMGKFLSFFDKKEKKRWSLGGTTSQKSVESS
nr:F-box protein [Ipomoea trifida]